MKAAPPTPIIVRIALMINIAPISSSGRSGLTNNCPRLRDHISSMKIKDTPSCPRNSTSQRSTAEINTPAACASHELWLTKNSVMNPQRIICIVGQYMSSSTRGHERRSR